MRLNFCVVTLVAWFLHVVQVHADPPVFSWPTPHSPFSLNVMLTGNSNATYVIEWSPDLRAWSAVNTNTASSATRTIELQGYGNKSFFRARRFPMPIFKAALLAQSHIVLNGASIEVDSFDSSDPRYSTDGIYDPLKSKDNALVAAYSGPTNTLEIGNAKVLGRLQTGQNGSVTIGPNGSVGSRAWLLSGQNGIEPGHYSDDLSVFLPPVDQPWSGGAFTPTAGTVGGTFYTYVLSSGNYQLASLNLSGAHKVLVAGDAVLYVTGNVNMAGEAAIIIATNANLKMYVGGPSTSLAGLGVINDAGNATNCSYYGLQNNTNVTLRGPFVGSVYAPSATVLVTSETNTAEVVGACVGHSILINGSVHWHFDENLTRVGPIF